MKYEVTVSWNTLIEDADSDLDAIFQASQQFCFEIEADAQPESDFEERSGSEAKNEGKH